MQASRNDLVSRSTSEESVYHRYAAAAQQREMALCCPADYAADFLSIIPPEILEREFGCGDPTAYTNEDETVLDLGSGGSKPKGWNTESRPSRWVPAAAMTVFAVDR